METSSQPLFCLLSGTRIQMATDYQDNDPKHTSKFIQNFFLQNGINWWKSPAESLNLNLIEKVWGSMKTYLRDKYKPRNHPELKEDIRAFGAN